MNQAIEAMENAFTQLANQQVQLPLRTPVSIEKEEALMLTMPAFLEKDKALGLKVVSLFPKNLSKNIPTITGFIMLLDADTGQPKALMDAGYLTALRTGAVSGLATKYFAKDDAHHVAMIGSGAQSLTQLEAVAAVRKIKQVSIWSRNIQNASLLAEKINMDVDIQIHKYISEATQDADIVCTATSSKEPLIHMGALKPVVHINAIGSHSSTMHEIGQDVLSHAVVMVDQLKAVLSESGEIIEAVGAKTLHENTIHEIGPWLLTKDKNYQNHLTVFKSVGLAIQDLGVAECVYQNAMNQSLGSDFSLQ